MPDLLDFPLQMRYEGEKMNIFLRLAKSKDDYYSPIFGAPFLLGARVKAVVLSSEDQSVRST